MENKHSAEGLEEKRREMTDFLGKIISIPAIGPASGGDGEWEKAELIMDHMKGFEHISRYDAKDDAVSSGYRPNIIAWLPGVEERRLFVVTHMDVVPPGDSWKSDPFSAEVKNGRLYGRGTEDNGQSLTASLFAARYLQERGIKPRYTIGLAMVSDEEADSEQGIKHLIREGVFKRDDLILVPDHGTPDGRLVEVSEKSMVWIRVTVRGKQCHASMPDLGVNAHRAAMGFGVSADKALARAFDGRDPLFDRPYSTFEPTKRERNVPNINTVPGMDVSYYDCRLVPPYGTSRVLEVMRGVADEVERETGTQIDLDPVLDEPAPPQTSPEADIVRMTLSAVDGVRRNKPFVGGIGGGTCASFFRGAGLPAAVWETCDNMAHAPNEYCVIDNMVEDSKVFASLFMASC